MNRYASSSINLPLQKTWWLLTSVLILSFLVSCFNGKKNEKTYCMEVFVYNHVTNEPIEGALIFQQSFSGSGFIQKAEIDTFITDARGIALVQSNQPVTNNSIGYIMPNQNLFPVNYYDSCGQVNPIVEKNEHLEIPVELLQFLVVILEVDSNDFPSKLYLTVNRFPNHCTSLINPYDCFDIAKGGIVGRAMNNSDTLVYGIVRTSEPFELRYCVEGGCGHCRYNPTYSIEIPRSSDTVYYHFTPKSK